MLSFTQKIIPTTYMKENRFCLSGTLVPLGLAPKRKRNPWDRMGRDMLGLQGVWKKEEKRYFSITTKNKQKPFQKKSEKKPP